VQAALETAKRAGVPVLGAEAADCEKPLYTHRVGYVEGTFEEWIFALGRALGVWTAVKSNGTGKTISLSEKGLVATERYQDGYVEGYEECSGCELYVTAYTGADLGPKLQATVEQALLQHPDANFIEGSYDGPITLSVIPALRAAGKLDAFGLIGGEGSPPFMKVVRDRTGMDAGYGTAIEWEAYAMLDNMNRIFTGEQPVDDSGIGVQVYDKAHNTPPSGGYQPPIDYRASFLKIWNGG
jgi:ribose transport system substrate-binding protein